LPALYSAALAYVDALGMKGLASRIVLEQTGHLLGGFAGELRDEPILVAKLMEFGRVINGTGVRSAERTRLGNPQQVYDPRFRFLPVGHPLPRVRRIETREGLLHKLHHTAFRETLAAELAALNIYEYDGLPWSFYIDMCRQVEDESRHAIMAAEMLQKKGGRLGDYPASYLGNFYDMNLSMSLVERLVSMNLDTEAVGQRYLARVAGRLRAIGECEVADMYDFITHDEKRHAAIGATWFRYLCPEKGSRKRAIDAARALTVVHLAVAHCQVVQEDRVANVVESWARGNETFVLEPFDAANHEDEISLTTARERAPA